MHKNAAAGVAAVVFLGIESVGPHTGPAVSFNLFAYQRQHANKLKETAEQGRISIKI
jgi:hypothetical protein